MAKMTKTQQRRALERINSTATKLYFSQVNQFMNTNDLLAINKIVTKCLKKL